MSMRSFSHIVVIVSVVAVLVSAVQVGLPLADLSLVGIALAEDQPTNLHICSADEITTIPELQSDSANACLNNQNTDAMPRALMCTPKGKSFCCAQKIDQIIGCTPITGGTRRVTPLRDQTMPDQTIPDQTIPSLIPDTMQNGAPSPSAADPSY